MQHARDARARSTPLTAPASHAVPVRALTRSLSLLWPDFIAA